VTRETKVGVGVSCAFLGLLAAVLSIKLREPDATTTEVPKEPEQVASATTPNDDQPEGAPGANPVGRSNPSPGNSSSPLIPEANKGSTPDPDTVPSPPMPTIIPTSVSGNPVETEPPPNPADSKTAEFVGPLQELELKELQPLSGSMPLAPPPSAVPSYLSPATSTPEPTPPPVIKPLDNKEAKQLPEPLPSPGGGVTLPPISDKTEDDTNERPMPDGTPKPDEDKTPKVRDVPHNASTTPPTASRGSFEERNEKNSKDGQDDKPVAVPAPVGHPPTGNDAAPPPLPSVTDKGPSTLPPKNTVVLPPMDVASPPSPKSADPPSIGATSATVTPPILAPVRSTPLRTIPAGAPQVESYDEEAVPVKPGDTFESISKRFYQTEAYAEALKTWNRNHPRASDALRLNGTLQPGDVLFVPPGAILEKRHGASIPNLKPLPASGAQLGDPVSSGVMQTTFDPARALPPPPAALPTYVVRSPGLKMRQIARETLNNGDLWFEVYRLNGKVSPEQPIPVGTVLLLPAGAKVPPENATAK
jgi:LysM repeat protein